jgi:hypothetical protein
MFTSVIIIIEFFILILYLIILLIINNGDSTLEKVMKLFIKHFFSIIRYFLCLWSKPSPQPCSLHFQFVFFS